MGQDMVMRKGREQLELSWVNMGVVGEIFLLFHFYRHLYITSLSFKNCKLDYDTAVFLKDAR